MTHYRVTLNDFGLQSLAGADLQKYETTLPSVVAAENFLRGKPGGFLAILSSALGRAGIIFAGLYLAGERKRLVRYALAGSFAIETFVLLRVRAQLRARDSGQVVDPARLV